MRKQMLDPGLIMMLSILVVEGVQIMRLRKVLATLPEKPKVTDEEREFIQFVNVVTDGYTA